MAEINSKVNLLNIKSLYIRKNIFSYIYNKQGLNIIINSKKFQKIFDINIIDYKKVSGKYKIVGSYGITKVFALNGNYLLFEGKYLNGKRNGEGKEFKNGKIIFKGEYLNGKRNGEGSEYEYNKLVFIGNYSDGKKKGKGKKIQNSKIIFEGEYLNDKIWNGKGYNITGNLEFEIKNGKGDIKCYDSNGNLEFNGEYLNGGEK